MEPERQWYETINVSINHTVKLYTRIAVSKIMTMCCRNLYSMVLDKTMKCVLQNNREIGFDQVSLLVRLT